MRGVELATGGVRPTHTSALSCAAKIGEIPDDPDVPLAGEPEYLHEHGTDWPICRMRTYLKFANELGLPPETREKIFWKNAVRFFKLPGLLTSPLPFQQPLRQRSNLDACGRSNIIPEANLPVTWQMLFVFVLIAVTFGLMVWEKLSLDVVAMLSFSTLLVGAF